MAKIDKKGIKECSKTLITKSPNIQTIGSQMTNFDAT